MADKNKEIAGRVPPNNEEAEKAVLGAMLLSKEAVVDMIERLVPDDFYRNAHKVLFDAIYHFHQENAREVIDLVTISDYLTRKGMMGEVGDKAYLAEIVANVPTIDNAFYYASIVKQSSLRRRAIEQAYKLLDTSFDESAPLVRNLEEASDSLRELTEIGSSKEDYKTIQKLIDIQGNYTPGLSSNGLPKGIKTGLSKLDDLTGGFQDSQLVILGARPSVGKTALAMTMAMNMASAKHPVGFFSCEMPAEQIEMRMLSAQSGIRGDLIRKNLIKPESAQAVAIVEAIGKLYDMPISINDTPNIKLSVLRSQARKMKHEQNVEAIFIDYMGLIDAETPNAETWQQISNISKSLKALARDLNIPIICLVQVGRESQGRTPTLADIRGSGSVEQDADIVIFLSNDAQQAQDNGGDPSQKGPSAKVHCDLAKNRNGQVGSFDLAFLRDITKFANFEYDSN